MNLPFIAIVPGYAQGGHFDRTHGVYLVNPLDVRLTEVYEHVGGFFCTDGRVLEAKPKTKGPFSVEPRSGLLLETASETEFGEFAFRWRVTYLIGGEQHSATFNAGKGLRETQPVKMCPILNRPAYLPRS